jgi:hypothetical protein
MLGRISVQVSLNTSIHVVVKFAVPSCPANSASRLKYATTINLEEPETPSCDSGISVAISDKMTLGPGVRVKLGVGVKVELVVGVLEGDVPIVAVGVTVGETVGVGVGFTQRFA